jgi:hypothetical protein
MKTSLTVATVLSWINIIVFGGIVAFCLLGTLIMGQMALLASVVLLSSIPLSCYAGLMLHRSIRRPEVPLSHQTPAGIRFVGLIALFFGIFYMVMGVSIIVQPRQLLDSMKEAADKMGGLAPAEIASVGKAVILFGGFVIIVLGLIVAINVILNIRLLRWYYLVHRSDVS